MGIKGKRILTAEELKAMGIKVAEIDRVPIDRTEVKK